MGATFLDFESVTTTGGSIHCTTDVATKVSPTETQRQVTMEGKYAELRDFIGGFVIGSQITGQGEIGRSTSPSGGFTILTDYDLTRTQAAMGRLTVSLKCVHAVYWGGIDFETIQKDIHTWRAKKTAGSPPYLTQIQSWESMKNDPNTQKYYDAFKYYDGTDYIEITDKETLALAKMIYRGIDSFNMYLPTLTLNMNLPRHPMRCLKDYSSLIGCAVSESDMIPTYDGDATMLPVGEVSGALDVVAIFRTAAARMGSFEILCTGESIQGNADGTYTLTRNFTAYNYIEGNLYTDTNGKPYNGADYTPYV